MDLAIARGVLPRLSDHPDEVFGVRQPRGHQVPSVLHKNPGVLAVEIRKPEGQAMPSLLDVNQFSPIWGASRHTAAELGIRELNGRRAVFLHAVELENACFIGMADDDFTQFTPC